MGEMKNYVVEYCMFVWNGEMRFCIHFAIFIFVLPELWDFISCKIVCNVEH